MSAESITAAVKQKLPRRLHKFFAKYPPQFYSAAVLTRPTSLPTQPAAESNSTTTTQPAEGSSSTTTTQPPEGSDNTTASPEAPSAESLPSPYVKDRTAKPPKRDPAAYPLSRAFLQTSPEYPNPFLPRKFGRKWTGPRYGLRLQADMVKLAKKYNVEALLPPGPKSTEYKDLRKEEKGLRIKGTGIGQNVKGHKWERTMETRLEERKKAVQEMPELINLWKQVSILFSFGVHRLIWCREVMVVDGEGGPRNKGLELLCLGIEQCGGLFGSIQGSRQHGSYLLLTVLFYGACTNRCAQPRIWIPISPSIFPSPTSTTRYISTRTRKEHPYIQAFPNYINHGQTPTKYACYIVRRPTQQTSIHTLK